MDIDKWKSQLRKGLVEFALLQLIRKRGRLYGLEIIEGLNSVGLTLTEGTLYPLLSRLAKEELLKPQWETENVSGHPRKYYSISSKGKKVIENMDHHWSETVESIHSLGEKKS